MNLEPENIDTAHKGPTIDESFCNSTNIIDLNSTEINYESIFGADDLTFMPLESALNSCMLPDNLKECSATEKLSSKCRHRTRMRWCQRKTRQKSHPASISLDSLFDEPLWTHHLKDCVKLGNSYRGWVSNEEELSILLSLYKESTQTNWGTRQCPGSNVESSRLMWRSQYVPFDGIPFLNEGKRAVVMECQYGPRRKYTTLKTASDFSCPARIYIKKVKKFPKYRVLLSSGKKVRDEMAQAFIAVKASGYQGGEERWYVQLPTSTAHEYHDLKEYPVEVEKSQMHPLLAEAVQNLVQNGETQVINIRKHLRKLVEAKLVDSVVELPERHDRTYYPTIHDIQNHVYRTIKEIQYGALPILVDNINVANLREATSQTAVTVSQYRPHPGEDIDPKEAKIDGVTLVLTNNVTGNDAVSKIEVSRSNGQLEVLKTFTPEVVRFLCRISPLVVPEN